MLSRSPDVRVAFIGDSFVAGVGDPSALGWVGRVVARARATGWDLTAYNLGVRRETTLDIQRRFSAELLPRLRDGNAHGVVIGSGVNDTTVDSGHRRATATETVTAFDELLDAAEAAGWPVLVVGPVPIDDPQQNERTCELSEALAQRCAERRVRYVETAASLIADELWMAEVASIDAAHPGAAGYARLSELIWPAFSSWLAGFGAAATGS